MELIPGQALGQSAGPAPRIILAALGRWSWAKKKPAAHWEPPAAKSDGDEAYHLYVKVARPISLPNLGEPPLPLTAGHTYQT